MMMESTILNESSNSRFPAWNISFDIWTLLARWTTWTPGAIISVGAVLMLAAPVAWQARYLQVSIDSNQVIHIGQTCDHNIEIWTQFLNC